MKQDFNSVKGGEKISVEYLQAIYPEGLNPQEMNDLVKERIVYATHKKSE